jgi:glucokinase
MSTTCLGVEIGGTKLQVVEGDASARILRRWRGPVDRRLGAVGIRAQLESALAGLIADRKPAAIGIGFGGPIDHRTGRVDCSHQVDGWADFDLTGWAAHATGIPACADNDANLAALGEAIAGAGAGLRAVFYTTLGSGVGGGVAIDGRIYHGAPPGEVEFGHLRLDRLGATVEQRCSGWAVDERIRDLRRTDPHSILCRLMVDSPGGEARHLAAALAAGDQAARRIIDETGADLAFALSHVVHLLHPEVLILGGGLSLVGEPLRQAVESSLRPHIMQAFHPPPPVRLARLGEDAVPAGALRLAHEAAAAPDRSAEG